MELGTAMRWRPWQRKAAGAGAPDVAEALARAARLGITPDRVLEEYRRIAFANLRHIVEWTATGMQFKAASQLDDEDVAAIAEIVESAKEGKPYRVKLRQEGRARRHRPLSRDVPGGRSYPQR
jgi:plasmid stabilization system protein ParE